MKHSESTAAIGAALAKAQAKMPVVAFDATNPFLKNKYASLGAVIRASRPILEEFGLAIIQLPTSINGAIGVETTIIHESGEWISTDPLTLPMGDEKGKSNAQLAGSIITYLRRYSLAAALGLYADEDTDGHDPRDNQQCHQNGSGQPQNRSQGSQNGHRPQRGQSRTQNQQSDTPMSATTRKEVERLAFPLYGANWQREVENWQELPLDGWGEGRGQVVIEALRRAADDAARQDQQAVEIGQ